MDARKRSDEIADDVLAKNGAVKLTPWPQLGKQALR